VFITLIVLCIAGIVFSTIAIDKQIDNYIEELKTEIKIVNNGNDEINIDHENNKIVITINPIEEEESEEVTEIRGMVISNDGLNIRQNPSVESERIGVLEYGSEVIILEDCGDWYRIDNGYIFKDYVIRI
jgi:uncharacterized protein YgiM (DUF1202 family)